VNQEQWGRVGSFAALVDEMDAYPIHLRFELSTAIEHSFVCTPVIVMQPVVGDILHIRQTDSICPADPFGLIREDRAGQTLTQIVEVACGTAIGKG
jgi:hypothetical protein